MRGFGCLWNKLLARYCSLPSGSSSHPRGCRWQTPVLGNRLEDGVMGCKRRAPAFFQVKSQKLPHHTAEPGHSDVPDLLASEVGPCGFYLGGGDLCQQEVVVNGTWIHMWRYLDLSNRTGEPIDSILKENLFLAVLDLCCCTWAFSSCVEWGLLTVVVSLVGEHGLQALGLSCSAACGIFLDQAWNPCSLHGGFFPILFSVGV